MYETNYKGIRYRFYDDHLSLNDVDLKYQYMNNIKHRSGDSPAFVFDYVNRTVALPYPPEELQQILPYFKIASKTFPDPDPVEIVSLEDVPSDSAPYESEPVYNEPAIYEEPDPVYEEPYPVCEEPVFVEPAPIPVPDRSSFDTSSASRSSRNAAGNKKRGCLVLALIVIALLAALFACFSGGDDEDFDDSAVPDDTVITDEAPEETATEPDPLADFTTEERNAYSSAVAYLATQGFSRSGLIKQLQFEKYSDEACEKAVSFIEENGEVDWNEECLESAKAYMSSGMSFSKDGLIQQLQFEGFTDDQINSIIDQAYE